MKKVLPFRMTRIALCLGATLTLAACATAPNGPSVMSLPGSGKSFDQFRIDDMDCRSFAQSQIGGTTADESARKMGIESAAVATVVGALAGAAVGGHKGAATGAAVGIVGGGLAGVERGDTTASNTQRRYDTGYIQCMYAKGHQVPVQGNLTSAPGVTSTRTSPGREGLAPALPPPPPPGKP
jgi:hypothetical protein